MTYGEFLNRVIDDGIAAARRDYVRPEHKQHLEGSLFGFQCCRGLTPNNLHKALDAAEEARQEALGTQSPDYWWYCCAWHEVNWVCNVVSAMLLNQGQCSIVTPTARGVMQAARILGVSEARMGA